MKKNLKGIPVDPEGKPYFTYQKIKDVINVNENYIYFIHGNLEYRPEIIEGKPIPVGSFFLPWYANDLYIYTNKGWELQGEEPQPVIAQILSAHATLTDGTSVIEEQDVTFEDNTVTITATQPGITKCILNQFNTYPEGVQVYHNGEVVEEVEFEDNIEITANEETSYSVNLVKPVLKKKRGRKKKGAK